MSERKPDAHDLICSATALSNTGFVPFDSEDRMITCNQRYRELYPDIAEHLEPGASFADIAGRKQREFDRLKSDELVEAAVENVPCVFWSSISTAGSNAAIAR